MRSDAEVRELIEEDIAWLFDNFTLKKADITKSVGLDRDWDLIVKLRFFEPLSEFIEKGEEHE